MVNAILSSEPDSASSFDPTLPADLDLILDKTLEKDRDLRYQTASDFRADLRRLMRTIESGTWSARRMRIRNPAVLAAPHARLVLPVAALVVLAAVSVGVWRFSQSQKAAAPAWGRATHVQLTEQPGAEHFPTRAPRRERVPFPRAGSRGTGTSFCNASAARTQHCSRRTRLRTRVSRRFLRAATGARFARPGPQGTRPE